MRFTPNPEPAHTKAPKLSIKPRKIKMFLSVVVVSVSIVGIVAIRTAVVNYQQSLYFQRIISQPAKTDTLAYLVDNVAAQDSYLRNTADNIDKAIAREQTLFAAGAIDGQCVQGTFDDFDQTQVDTSNLYQNTYDSNKWVMQASANSTFTTQNGRGLFFSSGNISDNEWGAVLSTKKQMLGDVIAEVDLGNLPLVNGTSGSGVVYRLILWQQGNDSLMLNVFTDSSNLPYASLARYDGSTNTTTYFNADGKELSDTVSAGSRVTRLSSLSDLAVKIQRQGAKVTATVTEPNSQSAVIGTIASFNIEPFYLATSFGVHGQSQTLIADVDKIKLQGCFAE